MSPLICRWKLLAAAILPKRTPHLDASRPPLVLTAFLAVLVTSRVPEASRSDVHVWWSGSRRVSVLDVDGVDDHLSRERRPQPVE